MLARIFAGIICSIAMLLPWRLRIIFADALGWAAQLAYLSYYGTLNFLLTELRKAQHESSAEAKHEPR